MTVTDACPCGGARYATCCEPFITGARVPATAEQLMRSRYTAYTRGDENYLLATWHASTRPHRLSLAVFPAPRWLGLTIMETRAGQPNDDFGTVEFVARYKVGGRAARLHETSRFTKEAGCWFYVDGDVAPTASM